MPKIMQLYLVVVAKKKSRFLIRPLRCISSVKTNMLLLCFQVPKTSVEVCYLFWVGSLFPDEEGFPACVGCIFSDVSDVDLENLKAAIWVASRRNIQVVNFVS